MASAFWPAALFFDGDDEVRILGEMVSANGHLIEDFVDVQAVVYDTRGNLIGRDDYCLGEFLLRQSFEIIVEDLACAPSQIRVFPTKS